MTISYRSTANLRLRPVVRPAQKSCPNCKIAREHGTVIYCGCMVAKDWQSRQNATQGEAAGVIFTNCVSQA